MKKEDCQTILRSKEGRKRNLTSILGCLTISQKQAQKLKVKSTSRWSPYLEKCCLLLSANESYQRAEEDLKVLTKELNIKDI